MLEKSEERFRLNNAETVVFSDISDVVGRLRSLGSRRGAQAGRRTFKLTIGIQTLLILRILRLFDKQTRFGLIQGLFLPFVALLDRGSDVRLTDFQLRLRL